MVHFSTTPSLIFFTMLIFLSSSFSMSFHEKQAEQDLNGICSRVLTDQSFCIQLLNSTPPGPGADLVTLAKYTIGVARTNVTNIITLLNSLIPSAGAAEKQQYQKCLTDYSGEHGALDCLNNIEKSLESKDYSSMNNSAMDLLGRNSDCILNGASFGAGKQTTNGPNELDEDGKILAKVGVILRNIIAYLTSM